MTWLLALLLPMQSTYLCKPTTLGPIDLVTLHVLPTKIRAEFNWREQTHSVWLKPVTGNEMMGEMAEEKLVFLEQIDQYSARFSILDTRSMVSEVQQVIACQLP